MIMMNRYGICNLTRDGTMTWFTSSGHFREDRIGNLVKIWADADQALGQLCLFHGSHVPNAYVAEYPSGKKITF